MKPNFRVWDTKEKKYIDGPFALISTSPEWGITLPYDPPGKAEFYEKYKGQTIPGNEGIRWFDVQEIDWADGDLICGRYETEQYLGVKDKNGNPICEGDIVITDEAEWVGEVIYDNGEFMCVDPTGGFGTWCHWSKFEIIGDKHTYNEGKWKK